MAIAIPASVGNVGTKCDRGESIEFIKDWMVERRGIEPLTSSLRTTRSTN